MRSYQGQFDTRPVFAMKEVTFELTMAPEDLIDPELAIDDPIVVERVQKDRTHNAWAWCFVSIKASFHGVEATSYLGGCNYEDREDFEASDIATALREEAFGALRAKLRALEAVLKLYRL